MINTYYMTFGFLVKAKDYLTHFGYTKENLPEERLPERKDGWDDARWNEALDEALSEWISDSHGGAIAWFKKIEVRGVEFVVRDFIYDSRKSDYIVVGVDLGSIDRWKGLGDAGVGADNCDPRDRIKPLAQDADWIKLIQACDIYSYDYSKIDYGVEHPKDGNWICPSTEVSTDDCD